jgi:hypothetical protein
MTTSTILITAALLALHGVFLFWYGGRGRPLSADETGRYLGELAACCRTEQDREVLAQVQELVATDDGREFVMQNLVRYRARAAYPPGYDFDADPRKADQRYGRAIVWPLLRYGNHPVFIARRSGRFIDPEGADQWHYVAMVRYRSKRDFLRFALKIERADIAVHKWAAIEKTHVFPVQALVSLVFVRATVASALIVFGIGLWALLG